MPWETNGLKYKPMQRGVGLYLLCESCNNLAETIEKKLKNIDLSKHKENMQSLIKKNIENILKNI